MRLPPSLRPSAVTNMAQGSRRRPAVWPPVWLWLAMALSFVASPAWARRTVYAVAIGNNQPPAADTSLRALRYADDDALRYRELFSRLATRTELLTVLDSATQLQHAGAAKEARPPTLTQLRATMQELRTALQDAVRRGERPVLFLTFSGHGAQTATGEYALSLLDGGLTQRILYDEILAGLEQVQVHLFVDACHAAGVVGVRGQFDRELDADTVVLDDSKRSRIVERKSLDRLPNVGAILASSSGEETHEWSRIQAGVFTHELLSALWGGADVNGDHRIEYSEVQAFVSAANRGLVATSARPNVLAFPPAADHRAVLVDLAELRDTVLLGGIPKGLGHFYVENENGRRLLDANLDPPFGLWLALPRTSSRVFLRNAEREAIIPSANLVDVSRLAFSPVANQSRGGMDSALQAGLFTNAYGSAYYRGYVDSMGVVPVDFGPPPAGPSPPAAEPPSDAAGLSSPSHRESVAPASFPPKGRSVGVGLAIASGVSLAASVALGVAAVVTKQEFDDTQQQRRANELADRYATFGYGSLVAAAVGAATGVGATILLLPRASVGAQAGNPTVSYGLDVQVGW